MDDSDIIKLWEDTVGDSGEAPTDKELCDFARAVYFHALDSAATDVAKVKTWPGLMRVNFAIWLRNRY